MISITQAEIDEVREIHNREYIDSITGQQTLDW